MRINKHRQLQIIDEEEVDDQDIKDALSSQVDQVKTNVEETVK